MCRLKELVVALSLQLVTTVMKQLLLQDFLAVTLLLMVDGAAIPFDRWSVRVEYLTLLRHFNIQSS